MSPAPEPCPVCRRPDSYLPVRPRGFWEAKVLSWIGMTPFRCHSCGHRARSRGRASAPRPMPPAGSRTPPDSPSQFLRSEDDRDFKDLILEIRRAEERMERDDREGRA